VRDDLRCVCHICQVEDHLFDVLAEPPGNNRFLALAASSPVLAKFTNISELLAYLHSPRTGDYDWSDAGATLTALLGARAVAAESELIHSVLVLAFAPTIHRTYTEVCAWFRELEPADIGQQILAFFLELVASAATENLAGILPIALSRSLRKASFRWAEKEQRALLRRQDEALGTDGSERASEPAFERISVLNDFLDHCTRQGLLSRFERQILLKFKVDGFTGKEIQDRHTVLSESAVYLRVHRIMQRLQDAALALSSKNGDSNRGGDVLACQAYRKKSGPAMKDFSLKDSADFLPISKSRGQLSLDSPLASGEGQ